MMIAKKIMVSGRVARVFAEESRETEQSYWQEESSHIFRTAFLLFAVTSMPPPLSHKTAEAADPPRPELGRDKNEDDILWARRCFRKAREMVTTPVRMRGMRR